MTREEIISDLAAIRQEMSFVSAKSEQPTPAARPSMAQFTQEELLAAAENNPGVKNEHRSPASRGTTP